MELSQILEKVFSRKTFIKEMVSYANEMGFSENTMVEQYLTPILKYYIATRDTKTDYSFEEIEKKYEEEVFTNDEYTSNVIDKGFLTHSFAGYKTDIIRKYGVNYLASLNDEEKNEIQARRDRLNKLESILR